MGAVAVEALRAESRRLVAAGSWSELSALLSPNASIVGEHPDCATLLGEALLRSGRPRDARAWLGTTLPRMQLTDDRLSLRQATVLSGAAHLELGEIDDARRAFEATLDLARSDRDDVLVARAMNNLGIVANIEGRWDDALALYHLAVSAYQRTGNSRGLSECYHNMAITHRDRGELAEADELERQSAEFARDGDQERLVALARLGRAEIALRRGDFAFAAATARRVARDFEALGDPIRQADATRLAGVACTGLGKYGMAAELLDAAVEATRQHGALLNLAETLRARAEMHAAMGNLVRAVDDARAALKEFEELGAARESQALREWLQTGCGIS